MSGQSKWSKDLVDLDLLERAVSFCPGKNVSALRYFIAEDGMNFEQFERTMLDLCVAQGCDGEYDLCCPYVNKGASEKLKVKTGSYTMRRANGNSLFCSRFVSGLALLKCTVCI